MIRDSTSEIEIINFRAIKKFNLMILKILTVFCFLWSAIFDY